MVELETMVDKVGVRNVLYALAHIARAKEEHIAVNWQDMGLARDWREIARHIEGTANKLAAKRLGAA